MATDGKALAVELVSQTRATIGTAAFRECRLDMDPKEPILLGMS